MTLSMRGTSTSFVEVTNISKHGFWLLVEDAELWVPFVEFPWFQNAPVAAILDVEQLGPSHLYWPVLDVDLEVDSILHPERYPLIADGAVT